MIGSTYHPKPTLNPLAECKVLSYADSIDEITFVVV